MRRGQEIQNNKNQQKVAFRLGKQLFPEFNKNSEFVDHQIFEQAAMNSHNASDHKILLVLVERFCR